MTGLSTMDKPIPTFDLPVDRAVVELREALKGSGIVRSAGLFRKERFVWVAPGQEWPPGSLALETSHITVGGLVALNGNRGAGLSSRVSAGDVVTAYALRTQDDDPRIPQWSRERGAPYFVEVCRYRVVAAGGGA